MFLERTGCGAKPGAGAVMTLSKSNFTAGLLAAGQSRRLGSDKALVEFCSKSLIQRATELMIEAGAQKIVIASRSETIETYRYNLGSILAKFAIEVEYVVPQGGGLSDSLRAVYASVQQWPLLLHQVDRPFVFQDQLHRLLSSYDATHVSQFSCFNGQLMPPVVLAPHLNGELMELKEDAGAALLFRKGIIAGAAVDFTPGSEAKVFESYFPLDVDDANDLERLMRLEGKMIQPGDDVL